MSRFSSPLSPKCDGRGVASSHLTRYLICVACACPTLGVFGEKDVLTNAEVAAPAMLQALRDGGNRDVAAHVFTNASHSLMDATTRAGMAAVSSTRFAVGCLNAWEVEARHSRTASARRA